MKNFFYLSLTALYLVFVCLFTSAYAGTCTSISRTNSGANTVLTSTKYNADLNTVYSHANDLDGGCITDGTLEAAALNSSEFAFLNKGIHQGCKVTKSNDSTISIDRCHLSVNGNFVSTTSATTESFGCSGCSTETSSTAYYVYAKSDSDGSTINVLLLTSAPNADGFDGSSNRVLARFYNNSSSNIDSYSIDQWAINEFKRSKSALVSYTPTVTGLGTAANVSFSWQRDGKNMIVRGRLDAGTPSAAAMTLTLPSGYTIDDSDSGSVGAIYGVGSTDNAGANAIGVYGLDNGSIVTLRNMVGDFSATFNGSSAVNAGETIFINFTVPIDGWN